MVIIKNMVQKNKSYKVGTKNYQMKPVPKELFKLIITYRDKLQKESNINKSKHKQVEISFVYAAKQFALEVKRKNVIK